ncbi:beta-ketoacyl synthase [Aphanothece hegewaldii CCALA 016]|uniref:Beta-ketoacyl synthase n=1 Tax=Aphanothece hegewaldii CCALA 016 TaxID=2107694 RepID=A0A2T1M1J3_9CHRO|nr:type I polyketide synthase [Aphanothece hegewaldii]PSF38589.1 beta-ketoacyl synthase [Aphanothece hegewaldii CCALA 016]
MSNEPIAIIGIGCRFPCAPNPVAFWQLMRDGKDAITEVPSSRWNVDTYYHPDAKEPNKTNTRWGGFLDQIDHFDPLFFGIAPREVLSMDPQQRLMLEVAYEALEDGGIIPEQIAGTRTGVFIGIGSHEYSTMLWHKPLNDPYSTTGTANCLAANRISYVFDFKGPSLAVDTACSSSLVAVHLACHSLYTGESTLAIAGGVNIIMLPGGVVGFTKGGFLSSEGRCKSFDADANGYVRSEGAGAVILKPLKNAIADGDRIYAIIRGTATNQDGRTSGLAAPNLQSQIDVLKEAYHNAGISPDKVQYIEAHGTGTKIGDRIELEALNTVLAPNRNIDNICAIGSVKSNIGHTETAAGIAGLIKVALALKKRQIPANLHFNKPNPAVDWSNLPLRVQETLTPWNNTKTPLIAGVNSFGFGGTNAHVVLEEAPISQSYSSKILERPFHLLTLSAKTEPALRELADHYRLYLEQNPVTSIADICYTANTRRSQFNYRLSVIAESREQLQENLTAFSQNLHTPSIQFCQVNDTKLEPIVFLFTGQGSQYINMGRQLYDTQPLFRQTLDRCAEILKAYINIPLLDVISSELIDQTIYTQPALFAFEYALATLWMSWGVVPSVVLGHSVGEYVAACLAGVFSLEDGLKLIAARGRLMQSLPNDGMMLAVLANETTVREAIQSYAEDVSIAAFNGTENFVISGRIDAIKSIQAYFTALSIKTKPLTVSHAFHSPLMEPILNDFAQVAREITYHQPCLSLISNLTGDFITDDIATPEYWCLHIRQAVKFAQSITTLQNHYKIFIEIGAQPTLLGMIRTVWTTSHEMSLLPSLRSGCSDWQQLLNSLSELYLKGYKINWVSFDQDYSRRLVTLPTYPFQRQRYWAENAEQFITSFSSQVEKNSPTIHPLLGQAVSIANSYSILFQTKISQNKPIYLQDHCLENTPIFPAAAYIEMAIAASYSLYPENNIQLKNVRIEQPLTLSEGVSKTIQLILDPVESQFKVFTINEAQVSTLHAQGDIVIPEKYQQKSVNLQKIKNECHQVLSIAEHYQNCQKQGLNYGSYFQGIQDIYYSNNQVLGLIKLPDSLQQEAKNYQLHPTVLDASFQIIGANLEKKDDIVYLPVGLESIYFYRPLTNLFWSFVEIKQQNTTEIKADIQLLTESGSILADLKGFTLKAVKRQSLEQIFQDKPKKEVTQQLENNLYYQISWQAKPKSKQTQKLVGNWLIFADAQGIGNKLADVIQKQGNHCILVSIGDTYICIDKQHYQINPSKSEDFKRLFNQKRSDLKIVHLWGLDESTNLAESQIRGCGSVLHLMQALNQTKVTHLNLITKNTQVVKNETQLQIQQSTLWGIARVIRLEYPDLFCRTIDLDSLEQNLQILENELLNPDNEEQIAYRDGIRYVPRLVPQILDEQKNESIQLKITQTGSLDNLTLTPLIRRKPAPDEIEIAVNATGVNFRDVLNALGMLQPYLEQMGFKNASDIPFGGECAGKIVAIGEAVKGLQIGDEVIAVFALSSVASFVTVKSQFVVSKPNQMTFSEAATIPSTFLTAYYGLHYLAKIKADDRILIHSAAGGVGLAAVQIAQRVGAKVFATASLPKWDFLREMGIQHIMNSRNLDFSQEIMTLTNNEGVDLVLNSLNGDYIPHSLQVLKKEGKFVEIGKIGVWNEEQVKQFRNDITYYHFDLLEIARDNPNLIAKLLRELMLLFQNGSLKPLPHKVFDIKESVNAFRYIAGAKHIGKVIISLNEQSSSTLNIKTDSTYLITGGLGALGLQVAQWLVQKGAKHLILVSRSNPSITAQETLQQLKQDGVEITITKGDISKIQDVNRIIGQKRRGKKQPPLAGIIHAAGVLDDGMLSNLTWERFKKVMDAKVQGAWNLHIATQELPLDFFVCFSSIVSLIGSLGQSSYVSANVFMDTLAHYRRSLGLHGLSINWGPWSDAGMAVNLEQNLLATKGITSITPKFGLQVLESLLEQNLTQSGVFLVDWSKFLTQLPPNKEYPFFEKLKPIVTPIPEKTTKQSSEFIQQFEATPKSEQKQFLSEHIRHQLARVLGFSQADQIDLSQNFSDLGMDSLMAVEFKNNLQVSLDITLSNNLSVDYPSVELLTNYLLEDTYFRQVENTRVSVTEIGQNEIVDIVQIPVTNNLHTNGHKPSIVTPQIKSEIQNIPQQFYKFEESSEYISLKNDINKANQLGNPFFIVRDGIAKDTMIINQQEYIHYSSYNYIGMSGDPRVSQAAKEAIDRYGTSVSASRILSGEIALHQALEKEIADFLGTEDCIVYIGGHTTNVTTIGHLFRRNDLILYDALSHNSIRQGCQMSGATLIEFPHNDWQILEQLLIQHRHLYEKVLIVIEGIYSTDGDIAPLPEIVELKKHYKTFLMVDEAHSIGVLGATGRGIGEYFNIPAKDVDLWMGTLSKSFASCGGYIAASKAIIEYLKYSAPGFVFSVGMTPANTASALAALQLLKTEPKRVKLLCDRSKLFLSLAQKFGFNTGISNNTPIIPIIIGEPDASVELCKELFKQGINVQPMVYPSVPYNAARLRFFITSSHTEEQIKFTLEALEKAMMLLPK